MLKITVIGNVGQDATIKTFGNANYIAFSVAHSQKYKDKNGVEHEAIQWISCLKRVGENSQLAAYIKKGTKVYVEGRLSAKVFDKSGTPEVGLNCDVSHLELLSSKTENQTAPHAFSQTPQGANATETTFTSPIVVPGLQGEDGDGLPF